jgi:hypothetical protein
MHSEAKGGQAEVPLRGIVNLVGDNYCYLNSVVQMIVRCKAIREALGKAEFLQSDRCVSNDTNHCPARQEEANEQVVLSDSEMEDEPAQTVAHTITRIAEEVLGTPPASVTEGTSTTEVKNPPAPNLSSPPQPPCAAMAMRTTLERYMDTGRLPVERPLQLTQLRRVVTYAASTFARGVMNDAAEAFERLIRFTDRDVQWHNRAVTAALAAVAPLQSCCAPGEEITRDFNGRDDDVSGVGLAVGYSCQLHWQCSHYGCPRKDVRMERSTLDYVCRLLVYPMLHLEDDSPRFSLAALPVAHVSFADIIRTSVLKNETFVCEGCGERTELYAERRWLPQGVSVFHLLWPGVPSPRDIRVLLLRVLEDAAAIDAMWDSVHGATSSESSLDADKTGGAALLTGIVMFQGSHYVALVRDGGNTWSVLNDAKKAVRVGGWEDVALFASEKKLAPLLLFFDTSAEGYARGQCGPSKRPPWTGEELQRRITMRRSAPEKPLQAPSGQLTLHHFYPASKVNLSGTVGEVIDDDFLGEFRDVESQWESLRERPQEGGLQDDGFRLSRKRDRPHQQDETVQHVREIVGPALSDTIILDALERFKDNLDSAVGFLLEGGWKTTVPPDLRLASPPRPQLCAPQLTTRQTQAHSSFMTNPNASLLDVMRKPVNQCRQSSRNLSRPSEKRTPCKALFWHKVFYVAICEKDHQFDSVSKLVARMRDEDNTIVDRGAFQMRKQQKTEKTIFDHNSEYVLTSVESLEYLARSGNLAEGRPYSWLREFLRERSHLVLNATVFLEQCTAVMDELICGVRGAMDRVNGLVSLPRAAQLREDGLFERILKLARDSESSGHAEAIRNALHFSARLEQAGEKQAVPGLAPAADVTADFGSGDDWAET